MDIWGITVVAWLVSLLGAAPGGPECSALVALDLQRSVAYASGSTESLAGLYVSPDVAGSDVRTLASWADRGLRLPAAMLVIGSCDVAESSHGRARLVVVDRLAPTVAVDEAGEYTVLPRDEWSERAVLLDLVGGRWRYAG